MPPTRRHSQTVLPSAVAEVRAVQISQRRLRCNCEWRTLALVRFFRSFRPADLATIRLWLRFTIGTVASSMQFCVLIGVTFSCLYQAYPTSVKKYFYYTDREIIAGCPIKQLHQTHYCRLRKAARDFGKRLGRKCAIRSRRSCETSHLSAIVVASIFLEQILKMAPQPRITFFARNNQ